MTVKTRASLGAEIDAISGETSIHALTPARVGGVMRDAMDSSVLQNEATTPPTAGNGLTGTSVFSVLLDGTTLSVSASGVKIADITGPGFLGRAGNTSGAVVPITGTEGEVAVIAGGVAGWGQVLTAGIADGVVTLAKLANIATDSLIGRDTAGTGAPENITLNSTLSMTGGGALQRAAISGVVSVPAGSNSSSYLSADFGALNVNTTGYYGVGAAGSLPSTGDIRVKNGFVMEAIKTTSANAAVIQFTGGDALVLGDNLAATIVNGSSLSLRIANVESLRVTSSLLISFTPTFQWDASQSSMNINQADQTGASTNGKKLTIHAQNATGTTSTGGALDIAPGSGTTAGGLYRVLTGGSAAQRFAANDTGVGFYAATPVAQAARVGQLTDSTTGTPSSTIGDVGGAFSQSTLNNIHASLLAKINALELLIHNVGASA